MPCIHVSIPKIKDVHVIKLYKTDLGTSPLYYGLSGRVNGGRRWWGRGGHWSIWLRLMPDFIFEMLEHKEQLIKNCTVYFNGMFMIYLFIF